jgi:hypothetical protein
VDEVQQVTQTQPQALVAQVAVVLILQVMETKVQVLELLDKEILVVHK